jgi:hypothetical protein
LEYDPLRYHTPFCRELAHARWIAARPIAFGCDLIVLGPVGRRVAEIYVVAASAKRRDQSLVGKHVLGMYRIDGNRQ